MNLSTNHERIVIDNGMMRVEGNLIALCDQLTKDEGFLVLSDDNSVYFFPTAYTVRFWTKGKWVYVNKVKSDADNDNPYYKIYS